MRRILAILTTLCLVLSQAHGLVPHHHHADSSSNRGSVSVTTDEHTHPNWTHQESHHSHHLSHEGTTATLRGGLNRIGAEICDATHKLAPHTDSPLDDAVVGKTSPANDHHYFAPWRIEISFEEPIYRFERFLFHLGSGSDPPFSSFGRSPPVA